MARDEEAQAHPEHDSLMAELENLTANHERLENLEREGSLRDFQEHFQYMGQDLQPSAPGNRSMSSSRIIT